MGSLTSPAWLQANPQHSTKQRRLAGGENRLTRVATGAQLARSYGGEYRGISAASLLTALGCVPFAVRPNRLRRPRWRLIGNDGPLGLWRECSLFGHAQSLETEADAGVAASWELKRSAPRCSSYRTLFGTKTSCCRPPPKPGRLTHSPWAVTSSSRMSLSVWWQLSELLSWWWGAW